MPLLTSFIIFIIIVQHAIRRSDAKQKSDDAAFFKREHDANFVRKKSLEDLDYIRIPVDRLPFGALPDNAEVRHAEDTVKQLAAEKIVNLTGISNTDLKLKYGTANITPLTEYDMRYLELARTLQKWGRELYASGLYAEALQVLTFAVETRTDITGTWHLYIECVRYHAGFSEEESSGILKSRIPLAESLDALSKEAILRELKSAVSE
ncbi:MAG: hypothetical protein K6G16_06510 [Lachnospiraceae bacterium]|nr:hypothetical protein [Lachnospiraceae bacterium]